MCLLCCRAPAQRTTRCGDALRHDQHPGHTRRLGANPFPDYQLDHERERRLQTMAAARTLEQLVAKAPGHVIVAGDLDADPGAHRIRSWTGRHVMNDVSVCYRSAWEATHPSGSVQTYTPQNPLQSDPDSPFPRIDHVFVRC